MSTLLTSWLSPHVNDNPARRRMVLFGLASFVQLLCLPALWGHTSVSGEFLGRYSRSYSLVLGLNVILTFAWLGAFVWGQKIEARLRHSPAQWGYGGLAASGIIMAATWFLPFESIIKHYLVLNWLLGAAVLICLLPERPVRIRRWGWLLTVGLALVLVSTILTALVGLSFSPDEALWADYASSPFKVGGLYARTWLQEPVTILPGLGWSVAAYGWMLENVSFDLLTGRVWNLLAYGVAILGVGAVTYRLYGRRAAVMSMTFAALSQGFLPVLDYRPDHQLPAAATWTTFFAVQARTVQKGQLWHLLCGLGVTFSLQLHAAGFIFAVGFSLFYLGEFVAQSLRTRKLASLTPLVWFGVSAFIGTALYYVFNIHSVGGLPAYLDSLLNSPWAGTEQRPISFLNWPFSLLEGVLVLLGLGFLAWRRSPQDKLLLGILLCVVVSSLFFDTQGYESLIIGFYVIPIGALLVAAFEDSRFVYASACLLAVMILQMSTEFVAWSKVATILKSGRLPPSHINLINETVKPYVSVEDTIASSHLLIWRFHDYNVVAYAAEPTAMKRWGLENALDVWERIKPTVVVYWTGELPLVPGLEAYMDKYAFQVCKTLNVGQTRIEIYRSAC